MKKHLKIALLVASFIGLAGVFYVYSFVYNKPHPDYANMEPEYTLLASDLFESYRDDRNMAENRFNGQLVQLNGSFERIEQIDSLMVIIFVYDSGIFGEEGIRCTLMEDQQETFSGGVNNNEIRIKGLVTGYNDSDVILEKCTIIN